MRRGIASVVAALALTAAGCGGSDEGQDATTAWAGGLCSALNTWSESLESAGTTLQDTSSLSAESVEGAVRSVVDATATLADDVQALGRPETEAGEQAQQTVSELAGTLQEGADTLQQTLDESGGGVAGVLEKLTTITSTLGTMASAVGTAFSELEQLDAKGELESAFEDADECDSLVSGSS